MLKSLLRHRLWAQVDVTGQYLKIMFPISSQITYAQQKSDEGSIAGFFV